MHWFSLAKHENTLVQICSEFGSGLVQGQSMTGKFGVVFPAEVKIFIFSDKTRVALGPTQLSV
jgi:hypothetical protein